jgi:hypothetical protein
MPGGTRAPVANVDFVRKQMAFVPILADADSPSRTSKPESRGPTDIRTEIASICSRIDVMAEQDAAESSQYESLKAQSGDRLESLLGEFVDSISERGEIFESMQQWFEEVASDAERIQDDSALYDSSTPPQPDEMSQVQDQNGKGVRQATETLQGILIKVKKVCEDQVLKAAALAATSVNEAMDLRAQLETSFRANKADTQALAKVQRDRTHFEEMLKVAKSDVLESTDEKVAMVNEYEAKIAVLEQQLQLADTRNRKNEIEARTTGANLQEQAQAQKAKTDEIDALKAALAQAQQEMADTQKKFSGLVMQADESDRNAKRLQAELTRIKQMGAAAARQQTLALEEQLEQQRRDAAAELEKQRGQHERELNELRVLVQQAKDGAAAMAAQTSAAAQEEAEELQRQLQLAMDSLEAAREANEQQVAALKQQIQELTSALNSASARIEEIEGEMAEMAQAGAAAAGKLAAMESDLRSLESQLEEAKAEAKTAAERARREAEEDMQARGFVGPEVVQGLKDEHAQALARAAEEAAAARDVAVAAAEAVAAAAAEAAAAAGAEQTSALEAQLALAKRDAEDMQGQLDEANGTIVQLREEVAAAAEQAAAAAAAAEQAAREAADAQQAQQAEAADAKAALQAELVAANANGAALALELQQERADAAEREATLVEQAHNLEAQVVQAEACTASAREEARVELDQLRLELAAEKDAAAELRHTVMVTEAQLAELQKTMEATQAAVEEAQARADGLAEELKRSQEALAAEQSVRAEERAKGEELRLQAAAGSSALLTALVSATAAAHSSAGAGSVAAEQAEAAVSAAQAALKAAEEAQILAAEAAKSSGASKALQEQVDELERQLALALEEAAEAASEAAAGGESTAAEMESLRERIAALDGELALATTAAAEGAAALAEAVAALAEAVAAKDAAEKALEDAKTAAAAAAAAAAGAAEAAAQADGQADEAQDVAAAIIVENAAGGLNSEQLAAFEAEKAAAESELQDLQALYRAEQASSAQHRQHLRDENAELRERCNRAAAENSTLQRHVKEVEAALNRFREQLNATIAGGASSGELESMRRGLNKMQRTHRATAVHKAQLELDRYYCTSSEEDEEETAQQTLDRLSKENGSVGQVLQNREFVQHVRRMSTVLDSAQGARLAVLSEDGTSATASVPSEQSASGAQVSGGGVQLSASDEAERTKTGAGQDSEGRNSPGVFSPMPGLHAGEGGDEGDEEDGEGQSEGEAAKAVAEAAAEQELLRTEDRALLELEQQLARLQSEHQRLEQQIQASTSGDTDPSKEVDAAAAKAWEEKEGVMAEHQLMQKQHAAIVAARSKRAKQVKRAKKAKQAQRRAKRQGVPVEEGQGHSASRRRLKHASPSLPARLPRPGGGGEETPATARRRPTRKGSVTTCLVNDSKRVARGKDELSAAGETYVSDDGEGDEDGSECSYISTSEEEEEEEEEEAQSALPTIPDDEEEEEEEEDEEKRNQGDYGSATPRSPGNPGSARDRPHPSSKSPITTPEIRRRVKTLTGRVHQADVATLSKALVRVLDELHSKQMKRARKIGRRASAAMRDYDNDPTPQPTPGEGSGEGSGDLPDKAGARPSLMLLPAALDSGSPVEQSLADSGSESPSVISSRTVAVQSVKMLREEAKLAADANDYERAQEISEQVDDILAFEKRETARRKSVTDPADRVGSPSRELVQPTSPSNKKLKSSIEELEQTVSTIEHALRLWGIGPCVSVLASLRRSARRMETECRQYPARAAEVNPPLVEAGKQSRALKKVIDDLGGWEAALILDHGEVRQSVSLVAQCIPSSPSQNSKAGQRLTPTAHARTAFTHVAVRLLHTEHTAGPARGCRAGCVGAVRAGADLEADPRGAALANGACGADARGGARGQRARAAAPGGASRLVREGAQQAAEGGAAPEGRAAARESKEEESWRRRWRDACMAGRDGGSGEAGGAAVGGSVSTGGALLRSPVPGPRRRTRKGTALTRICVGSSL